MRLRRALGLAAAALLVACSASLTESKPASQGAPLEVPPASPAPSASGPAVASSDPTHTSSEPPAQPQRACTTDTDCVPATCCHPSACTHLSQAPRCDGVMCTRDCRGGTLDCGGHCLCQNGFCAAQLAPPRHLPHPG